MQPVEEDAEPAVGHRHLGRVDRPHPGQQDRPVRAVEIAAHRRVVGARRLRAVVVRVAVHVHVAPRRRPGLVRLEGVDHDRERALARRRLEHARGVAEDARRERARLVVRVAAVGEVAAHPVARVGVLDLGRQPVAQLAVRDAVGAAADLPAAPHEAVEAAPKRPPRRREAQRRVVGDVGGPVARPAQGAGERRAHVGDRSPARLGQQPRVGMPAAEREDASPRQDRPPRGDGRHRLGVEAGEAQPLARQRVDVGRARPLAERVIGPERVDDDQHDVGSVAGLGEREPLEAGERARSGARGLEESPAAAGGGGLGALHAPRSLPAAADRGQGRARPARDEAA